MGNTSIKRNYIYNVSYQIFTLIVPLIVTPYISRVLGTESIGIYSYTYSIVSYFALLASLGTNTYGVKNIGSTNSIYERSIVFFNVFSFKIIASIISIAMYFFYCFFVSKNGIIAYLQALYILGVMLDVSWFFQGIQEFKKITLRNFVFKIISVSCIFLFVHNSKDLWIYILCLSGITVIGNCYMLLFVPRHIIKVPIKEIHPFTDIKPIIILFFPTIATQIYSLIDKTLIGSMIHETTITTNGIVTVANLENAYYEQSEKIVKMCLMVITSLGTVMIPKISYANKYEKYNDIKHYIKTSFHFVWLLSIPMCFGVIAISNILVPVFFGEGFEKVCLLLPVFSLLFIFMGLNSVIGNQYLISTGRQNKYMIMLLIGGTVNLMLDLLFIPRYYSLGAAVASVIGEIIISIIGCLYMNHIGICNINDIFQPALKCLVAGCIMFAAIKLSLHIITNNNLFVLFITIVFGGVVYFSALLLLKDEMLINELERFINRLFNK